MLPIWTLGETSQRFCPCPEGPARRRREPLRARVVAEPVLQHTGSSPTTSTAALAVRKTSCYHARTCEVAAESRGAKALRLSLFCISGLVATQQHDVRSMLLFDPSKPPEKGQSACSPSVGLAEVHTHRRAERGDPPVETNWNGDDRTKGDHVIEDEP